MHDSCAFQFFNTVSASVLFQCVWTGASRQNQGTVWKEREAWRRRRTTMMQRRRKIRYVIPSGVCISDIRELLLCLTHSLSLLPYVLPSLSSFLNRSLFFFLPSLFPLFFPRCSPSRWKSSLLRRKLKRRLKLRWDFINALLFPFHNLFSFQYTYDTHMIHIWYHMILAFITAVLYVCTSLFLSLFPFFHSQSFCPKQSVRQRLWSVENRRQKNDGGRWTRRGRRGECFRTSGGRWWVRWTDEFVRWLFHIFKTWLRNVCFDIVRYVVQTEGW